jgi:hypothetical protein
MDICVETMASRVGEQLILVPSDGDEEILLGVDVLLD